MLIISRYHSEIMALQKGDILGHEVRGIQLNQFRIYAQRFTVYGQSLSDRSERIET